MGAMASHTTSLTTDYSKVYSGTDKKPIKLKIEKVTLLHHHADKVHLQSHCCNKSAHKGGLFFHPVWL